MNKDIVKLVEEVEDTLNGKFLEVNKLAFKNSLKVLNAFKKYNINENSFVSSTGYGYNDYGREQVEKVFAEVLGGEDALVRNQIISGSHALTIALFAFLRPGDTLLSITGLPYDTLHEVIGIKENDSSLKSFGINYKQIDLINDDFDYEKIKDTLLNEKIKVIEIQRSKGYSTRKSIDIQKLEKVIKFIKEIDNNIIIMVDSCYTEFVSEKSSLEVGADVMIGSLIKNLGGGIASNGGYIVGRSDLVGKPLAQLMINNNATVTLCHSKTKDLSMHTRNADILVAAVGKPKMIKKEDIKEGAVIIDVGINRLPDQTLCGDVDFEDVKEKASYITPVPGGVGQMTVYELGNNTYKAKQLRKNNNI